MNEYHVVIYGRLPDDTRIDTTISTKAESPRMAILQVSGIDERGIWWDERYRDDVTIWGYEVMK